MHPTRDTLPLINLQLVGGRVMPGVRRLHLTLGLAAPYSIAGDNEKHTGTRLEVPQQR